MKSTIQNGTVSATFDTFGGTLTSLTCEGVEYIWKGDPAYWSGQSPVMFPMCGSLRNDTATIGEGKTCTMGRHGIAKNLEFTDVTEKVAGKDSTRKVFELTSTEETRKQYPFDFSFSIEYTLEERGITFTYHVKNTGDVTMPFFTGGHPGFNCPLLPGEEYTDYSLTFEKEETANCMYPLAEDPKLLNPDNRRMVLNNEKTLKLNHDLFLNDGLVFDSICSKSVTYSNPKTGKGVRLDFADFDYLVVWSPVKASPFVCIEPWLGFSTLGSEDDVFEHKQNVQFCEPGQERTYSFTITIL